MERPTVDPYPRPIGPTTCPRSEFGPDPELPVTAAELPEPVLPEAPVLPELPELPTVVVVTDPELPELPVDNEGDCEPVLPELPLLPDEGTVVMDPELPEGGTLFTEPELPEFPTVVVVTDPELPLGPEFVGVCTLPLLPELPRLPLLRAELTTTPRYAMRAIDPAMKAVPMEPRTIPHVGILPVVEPVGPACGTYDPQSWHVVWWSKSCAWQLGQTFIDVWPHAALLSFGCPPPSTQGRRRPRPAPRPAS